MARIEMTPEFIAASREFDRKMEAETYAQRRYYMAEIAANLQKINAIMDATVVLAESFPVPHRNTQETTDMLDAMFSLSENFRIISAWARWQRDDN